VTEALYRLTADGARPFCAGLVARDDIVVQAAPILRQFEGWHVQAVHTHSFTRGWTFEAVSWWPSCKNTTLFC